MTALGWRPMCPSDVDGVVAVAAAAFPGHFEARACFAERLALFPQGCFALAADNAVRGYLIAYPWPRGSVPPLNSLLGGLPNTSEALYLHDLALHPAARGQGHARPIIERLVQDARHLGTRTIALVSVNHSVPFWQHAGFAVVDNDPAIARKLESYGTDARYMIRGL